MKLLVVSNAFGAPVYHEEIVSSTMDVARRLADKGAGHGTVIATDFQEAGRGRGTGRPWNMDRGESLPFTILLRYDGFAAVPAALTLRVGLAVALAIEAFATPLAGLVRIKWPNDIMCPIGGPGGQYRKIAGILTEGDGRQVLIGIGVNVAQTEFPPELQTKAGSIAQALQSRAALQSNAASKAEHSPNALAAARFTLLEKIVAALYQELEGTESGSGRECWRDRLEERLFMKDGQVSFSAGGVDSGVTVRGKLVGIGAAGEIRILSDGETEPQSFVTGELQVYG
ncbi:MAG: biotin--[acetyl-CoA-carboxylase] ligase [Treponema sp.]|jgi:BirA family biotin operon repressor/biotin-[acetyl-CoA-carboxylase] ligase|nr:biotin--[acetyl-CoA-carboxylase] ligase [Treponema sp.]